MAITAADIHNQSFSVDRKGYDVDEVDVFLERVAEEIDELNAQVAELERELDESRFGGLDRMAETGSEPEPSADLGAELAEKDERIAELERQLEARRADDNAIAQALIVAQRSGDQIVADANVRAAATTADAEAQAKSIIDEAQAERQEVLDAIKKLEDDREDARNEYKMLLTDFISDATRKLSELGSSKPASAGGHARVEAAATAETPAVAAEPERAGAQAPVKADAEPAYVAPQPAGAVAAAPTPHPTTFEKDFSGFGDAEVAFEFEELD